MSFGVAVLGTGRIGGNYIDVVKKTPGADIKVVAEPREDAAATWQDRHPDVDFVADYRDALARDDVAVIIGTLPHWLHHQAALDAAAAGKHIYMEKPTAVWASQAEEMLAAARENGVKLMTAHTQRYYPAVRAMKGVVDSGDLGSVIMAYDVWHKPYTPYNRPEWMLDRERGGGMGQMDGSHQIDRCSGLLVTTWRPSRRSKGSSLTQARNILRSTATTPGCTSSAGRAASSQRSAVSRGIAAARNMAAIGSLPTAWRGSDFRTAAATRRRFISLTRAAVRGARKTCRSATAY